MTDLATLQAVAGGQWREAVETASGVVDGDRLALLAGVLGGDPPTATVPPMWAATVTARWPAYDDLGPDGHPVIGVGYPPLPDRRRLFAGARLVAQLPLRVGEAVQRQTRVTEVRAVEGRSGALLFVTIEHVVSRPGGEVVAVEEHDLAYRSGPPPVPTVAPPPVEPSGTSAELQMRPDAVALFRFSALTGNSHRIHYDESYARDVEGLAGRLVHGPLLGLLLLELPRRVAPDLSVATFGFRVTRPVVLGSQIEIRRTTTTAAQWTLEATADGHRCADATVTFAEGGEG